MLSSPAGCSLPSAAPCCSGSTGQLVARLPRYAVQQRTALVKRSTRLDQVQPSAPFAEGVHQEPISTQQNEASCSSPTIASNSSRPSSSRQLPMAMQLAHRSLRRLRIAAIRQARMCAERWRAAESAQGSSIAPVMALTVTLPAGGVADLLTNQVLMTGFWAWFFAQFGKIFTKAYKKKVWDIRAMVEPGGMPSSHSALCSGITTAVALTQGINSSLFAVCVAFSVIVMYDAMGVRQHAGKQAEVLNQVVNEVLASHPKLAEVKLKEVLGHTPRQVVCGAILGIVVGLLYPNFI